jgi:hypothetical protein
VEDELEKWEPSDNGNRNIDMSFDTKGIGEYHATYEIDSRHTSMDTSVFDAIATMTVSRKAIRNATSVMKGSVTIGLYPVESYEELIMSLVSISPCTDNTKRK